MNVSHLSIESSYTLDNILRLATIRRCTIQMSNMRAAGHRKFARCTPSSRSRWVADPGQMHAFYWSARPATKMGTSYSAIRSFPGTF